MKCEASVTAYSPACSASFFFSSLACQQVADQRRMRARHNRLLLPPHPAGGSVYIIPTLRRHFFPSNTRGQRFRTPEERPHTCDTPLISSMLTGSVSEKLQRAAR